MHSKCKTAGFWKKKVPGDKEVGGELLFNGYKVSVIEDEWVLNIWCTTLC